MSIQNTIDSIKLNLSNAYDSIEAKHGTIPTYKNMVNLSAAIDSIQLNSKPSGTYTLKVVDYDGTLIDEMGFEANTVYTFPQAPTHSNLTFLGWITNISTSMVTSSTITLSACDVMIGPVYDTKSGDTEADIELTVKTGLNYNVSMSNTAAVTIDWGDGTTTTKSTTSLAVTQHTYADYGNYTLKFHNDSGKISSLDMYYTTPQSSSPDYTLKSIRYSTNMQSSSVSLSNHAGLESISFARYMTVSNLTSGSTFTGCKSLKCIIIPENNYYIGYTGGSQFLYGCYSLKHIVICGYVRYFDQSSALYDCVSLEEFYLPPTPTTVKPGGSYLRNAYSLKDVRLTTQSSSNASSIGSYCFANNYTLEKVTLPDKITSIPSYCFQNCYNLEAVVIPGTVTTVNSYAFANCYKLIRYDFSNCTSVPTLSSTNAFNSVDTFNSSAKIIVPDSLYATWTTTSNWSTFARWIYKESEV